MTISPAARWFSCLSCVSVSLSALLLAGCWKDAPPSQSSDAGADASRDGGDAGGSRSGDDDDGDDDDDGGDRPRGSRASGALCGVSGRDACGAYLACDPALGCVACLTDTDCPLAEPRCVRGNCQSCDPQAADPGCSEEAPSCWPADGTCHTSCATATCPATAPRCEPTSGRCLGCTSDRDCTGKVCSPFTRQCVECNADDDCPTALPRCDAQRSVCVACSSDTDCGRTQPICDPATRRCRVGCTANTQCATGERCDLGTATCVAAPQVDGGAG